jgi:hypothetical protein
MKIASPAMPSSQILPAISGTSGAAPNESSVVFDLKMKSSWGQALPVRVRSDFNMNDVRSEILKKYSWAPKSFRLLLHGQEPRMELTLKDLGIEETSILHMQSESPPPIESESIYRELSHLLYESKTSDSQWRCAKATSGVARSGLLQSMHDPNKGVSDFSDFLKQRMGEVREFSSDWSRFNQALHRYEKIVNSFDLGSIKQTVPTVVDTNSYIRSIANTKESFQYQRVKRVSAPQLKCISVHRSFKSKHQSCSSHILDRDTFLKEARNYQHLLQTDFMHKAQSQFLQQQMDNLQKIIVEKGPLEVDPAKACRRMEIACTLPWDESLHRGYRESPEWLRQQKQIVEIPGDAAVVKSKVTIEQAPKAAVTVTCDFQDDMKTDSISASSPPKGFHQRITHISDPAMNRHAVNDAVTIYAKYSGTNYNLDFCPPPASTNDITSAPHSSKLHHLARISSEEKAFGIRAPTIKNSSITKRGLSKDWRER